MFEVSIFLGTLYEGATLFESSLSLVACTIMNVLSRGDVTTYLLAKMYRVAGFERAGGWPDVHDYIQMDARFALSYSHFFFLAALFLQRGIAYNNWSFEGDGQFAFSWNVWVLFWLSLLLDSLKTF